jgi:hypothetical protein
VADTSQQAADEFFPSYAAQMTQSAASAAGRRPRARSSTPARPRGHLAVGSPQEVIEKILRQHEALGHQRYLMQMSVGTMPHAQTMRSIELLGNQGRARCGSVGAENVADRSKWLSPRVVADTGRAVAVVDVVAELVTPSGVAQAVT